MTEDSRNSSTGRARRPQAESPGRVGEDPRFAEFDPTAPRGGFRAWHDALHSDFRLAMVTLFVVVAAIVILPFAIFRFKVGDWQIALFDLVLVVAMLAVPVWAWRFGRSELAGKVLAGLVTVGVLVAILVFGRSEIWVFAVLVANFLLATGGFAAMLSAGMIGTLMLQTGVFADPVESWTFLSVSVLVALFSAIFASRSSLQQASLNELAHRDPLTGAGNRRALRQDLTRIVSLGRERRLDAGLAVLDLDRFKPVNDRHGHDTGDRILVEFAEIIHATMRTSDRCYRFGGDEFVVLLTGTGRDGLAAAAAKLHERIRAELESPDGPVTVSIGATELRPDDTAHAWLSRADQALYRAKTSGRDRIEIADCT